MNEKKASLEDHIRNEVCKLAAMRKGNQPETINISFLIIGDIP